MEIEAKHSRLEVNEDLELGAAYLKIGRPEVGILIYAMNRCNCTFPDKENAIRYANLNSKLSKLFNLI